MNSVVALIGVNISGTLLTVIDLATTVLSSRWSRQEPIEFISRVYLRRSSFSRRSVSQLRYSIMTRIILLRCAIHDNLAKVVIEDKAACVLINAVNRAYGEIITGQK